MDKFFNLKVVIFLLFSMAVSGLLGAALATYFFNKNHFTCTQNKEAIVRLIEEVWNKGNFKTIDQLIASQYTIRHDPGDPWEGKTIDLSTFKERVKISRDVLPDQKFYIKDLVCEDDKVAISWRFKGTQKANLPGLQATNKVVNISGLTIYYFSKGKIIGHWQVFDKLGLLEQLGVQIGKAKIN